MLFICFYSRNCQCCPYCRAPIHDVLELFMMYAPIDQEDLNVDDVVVSVRPNTIRLDFRRYLELISNLRAQDEIVVVQNGLVWDITFRRTQQRGARRGRSSGR